MSEMNLPQIVSIGSSETFSEIALAMPEHKEMLAQVEARLPEFKRATSLFCKTQSQFMDNMLTVTQRTPLRVLHQILAEMEKVHLAMREAYFKCRKKEVEIRKKLAEEISDPFEAELRDIEVAELKSGLDVSRNYIAAAVRKLANYQAQYDLVLKQNKLEGFSELDFEREEPRFHIIRAFEQALCAARANGGTIDEGNHIYLMQMGINGATAQHHITAFLVAEKEALLKGLEPNHKDVEAFLNAMADKFASHTQSMAQSKAMQLITESAALVKGDERLLQISQGGK